MKARIPMFLAALTLGVARLAPAEPQVGYDVDWHTLDGGGGHAEAGGYSIDATVSQGDAQLAPGGGGYALQGGFWSGARTGPSNALFSDQFE